MNSPQAGAAARLKELGVLEPVDFNTPPKPQMGDFSTPVALKIARSRKMAPLALAAELQARLQESLPPYIRQVTVSPPGFLNFFVDDRSFAADLIRELLKPDRSPETPLVKERVPGKIEIEHTNVNPNKAMHVGHLRNAVLGDTIVRALKATGHTVETCNYIDDTGVQVVDVVTALLYLDEPYYQGEGEFGHIWAKIDPAVPPDYACWDIYARVQDYLARGAGEGPGVSDQQRQRVLEMRKHKESVMHAIEDRETPIARFAKDLAERIVHAHLKTAGRVQVFYDLLNWESDVLGAGFWHSTFDRLRESGAIRYEEEGPNRGCWIVPLGGIIETEQGVRSLDRVLVRSNGTITYTAKDIAYQLWKFGRLDADFHYRAWGRQANGQPLWTTAPDGEAMPGFGHATRVINVIDVRQSEPQQTVYECLARLGFEEEAANSVHLAYEVVALSREAAQELGVEVAEGIQQVSMSGRKGLGVKADDLIDRMKAVILTRMKEPDPDAAEILAAAAVRYYMLKFSTNTIIRFDFEEASRTDGDTGVYLLYSYARASNILSRAGASENDGEPASFTCTCSMEVPESLLPEEITLVREMGRLPDAVQQVVDTLSTTPLTTYAFALASAFASFYDHTPPIIHETDPAVKTFRLALVAAFRQAMKTTLSLLGIPTLERI